jgi:hypothetical protein
MVAIDLVWTPPKNGILMHRQGFEPTHETPRARAARPYIYSCHTNLVFVITFRKIVPST